MLCIRNLQVFAARHPLLIGLEKSPENAPASRAGARPERPERPLPVEERPLNLQSTCGYFKTQDKLTPPSHPSPTTPPLLEFHLHICFLTNALQ